MKLFKTIVICAILSILFVAPLSFGKKDRPDKKLNVGAYLSTVKIEVVSGDPDRLIGAIKYLEDLFYWYGPHAEALFWMNQIEVDYIEKTEGPKAKMPHVKKFVAYVDSLEMCCDKDNKDVKKKYKKKCNEYVEKSDSTIVNFWREYYNNGINMMNENIASIQEDIAAETDSAVIVRFQEDLQANVDSIVANFELCLVLDPAKVETYIGLRAVFEKIKDYENAIKWLAKGIEIADDKVKLLQTISYDYISMNDYAGAIPYMRDYLELAPDDILTMGNLAICYNSQKMHDSSFAVNQRMLTIDSTNVEAISSIGHYFRQRSLDAADSVRTYKEAKNETATEEWTINKEAFVDSFLVYYKRVLVEDPKNEQIQFLYATYNYFRSNWDIAIAGFQAATEINPQEKDYWRSLGDCFIQTKEYAKSAESYEKVIELDSTDIAIWEQLVSLYSELKKPEDKARAEKHVKALQ